MSCSMELVKWCEECYEEQGKEEKVPINGVEAVTFIKNYIKKNYSSLNIDKRGSGTKGAGDWCRIRHSRWKNHNSAFDGPSIILEDKLDYEGVFTTPHSSNMSNGENLINGRFFGFTIPFHGKRKMFDPRGKNVSVIDDIFKKLM